MGGGVAGLSCRGGRARGAPGGGVATHVHSPLAPVASCGSPSSCHVAVAVSLPFRVVASGRFDRSVLFRGLKTKSPRYLEGYGGQVRNRSLRERRLRWRPVPRANKPEAEAYDNKEPEPEALRETVDHRGGGGLVREGAAIGLLHREVKHTSA